MGSVQTPVVAPEIRSVALTGCELLLTSGTEELRSVTLIGLKSSHGLRGENPLYVLMKTLQTPVMSRNTEQPKLRYDSIP